MTGWGNPRFGITRRIPSGTSLSSAPGPRSGGHEKWRASVKKGGQVLSRGVGYVREQVWAGVRSGRRGLWRDGAGASISGRSWMGSPVIIARGSTPGVPLNIRSISSSSQGCQRFDWPIFTNLGDPAHPPFECGLAASHRPRSQDPVRWLWGRGPGAAVSAALARWVTPANSSTLASCTLPPFR